MLTEQRLIEWDGIRPSLKKGNGQAAFWRRSGMLAWAVVSILSQACAIRVMPSDALSGVDAAQATITISNDLSRAMRIYLSAGSAELSLGTVPALATRTFFAPHGFTNTASEFQIEARERGAELGFLTERFTLGPQRVVAWTLSRAGSKVVTLR
jgi:hypothetical protein